MRHTLFHLKSNKTLNEEEVRTVDNYKKTHQKYKIKLQYHSVNIIASCIYNLQLYFNQFNVRRYYFKMKYYMLLYIHIAFKYII